VYALAVSIIAGEQVRTGAGGSEVGTGSRPLIHAPLGPTLTLTLTLAAACFLVAMAAVLSVLHPPAGVLSTIYIRQNQSAKTGLYVGAFVALLPLAVVAVPRLADRISSGANASALGPLVAALAASLALVIVLVRVLPFSGRGLHSVLIGVGAWLVVAAAVIARAAGRRPWGPLQWLARAGPVLAATAALAVFGLLLCVTALGGLSGLALGLGAAAALLIIWAWGRVSLPRAGRLPGGAVDVVVVVLLLLAVTNVVIYHASSAIPNGILPPGVVQFQQDWMLGPANQLLRGGGALLVGDPSSQYGVGLVYFLAAWFHVAPISYATFGLLDGLLTSLVYIGGYLMLRLAGCGRLLSAGALALGVAVFVYHLSYPVGSLPEQGPLRFGLPMAVIVAMLAAAARPRLATAGRVAAIVVVGISSIWAVEALAYTTFTYLALIVVEAVLGRRRGRWILAQVGWAVLACLAAHLILALVTLAATGYLPDWSQYLIYVNGLLLGGREGAVTYGFSNWSPGVALGAGCLASAAALVLLLIRTPARARAHPRLVLALAGATAYAIASYSYTDNRSNTYLLPYVALPLLLAAVLWLRLILVDREIPLAWRRGALAAGLSVGVLLLAAAWSTIGGNFSQSALARAYPSGGLSSALHRLWHPPPIDPRSSTVARLLDRYFPGRRALVVLPDAPDMAIEALTRSGKAISLYLGDPAMDMWNPSLWIPRISRQLASLPAGTPVLVDRIGLGMAARLRGRPDDWALSHPVVGGSPELEWILHRLDQRYRLIPIHREPGQFIVARLRPRSGAG
jgi:hypothetical protein